MPAGPDQADEVALVEHGLGLRSHVALEHGVPIRVTALATALVILEVHHADEAVFDADESSRAEASSAYLPLRAGYPPHMTAPFSKPE